MKNISYRFPSLLWVQVKPKTKTKSESKAMAKIIKQKHSVSCPLQAGEKLNLT